MAIETASYFGVEATALPVRVILYNRAFAGHVANGLALLQCGCADLVLCSVGIKRPAIFRRKHFEDVVILLCFRWYLRYSLSYRDLEEMMAERGLSVDHVTIWR